MDVKKDKTLGVASLHLANEPHQAKLIINTPDGVYRFEPNDDQLMLLLHQITHVIFSSCRQVRRFKDLNEL